MNRTPPRVDESLAHLNRSARFPEEITGILQEVLEYGHLVSPATACGKLPDGFEVAFSTILVDVNRETYKVKALDDDDGGRDDGRGDRGLNKVAIDRIGNALGIRWDPKESRRLDNGLDARYCRCQAFGYVRNFDNSTRTLFDQKEIDLREGSDYIVQLQEQAKRRNRTADLRIRNERIHILSNCVTKARLRVLRQLGIRTSYKRDELERPFVVARLMLTGDSEDPVLRRQFALLIAQQSMDDRRTLYGSSVETDPTSVVEMPPGEDDAPPVGTTRADAEDLGEPLACDYCGTTENVDWISGTAGRANACRDPKCTDLACADANRAACSSEGAPPGNRTNASTPAAPSASFPPRDGAAGARPRRRSDPPPAAAKEAAGVLSGFTIPGGDEKGSPIEQATDGSIQYWIRRIDGGLRDGTAPARFVESNQKLLAGLRAEIDRRNSDDRIPF